VNRIVISCSVNSFEFSRHLWSCCKCRYCNKCRSYTGYTKCNIDREAIKVDQRYHYY
jgi:hypothetical protein